MDVILSRAGFGAAQQRTICLDAVNDEVIKTEAKLRDALASLKQLREVVRVARGVHKTSTSLSELAPRAGRAAVRLAELVKQISPLVGKIRSDLRTPSVPNSHETSESSEEEEEEDDDGGDNNKRWRAAAISETRRISSSLTVATHRRGTTIPRATSGRVSTREASTTRATPLNFSTDFHLRKCTGQKRRANTTDVPSRSTGNSFLRPTTAAVPARPVKDDAWDIDRESDGERYTKRQATMVSYTANGSKDTGVVADLKRRLSRIPDEEDALHKGLQSALGIAQRLVVEGKEEEGVQEAVDNAREATIELLKRDVEFSIEQNRHIEDVLHILSVTVRAILTTKGKLEASGLRGLHQLIKQVQDKFTDTSARFQWCNTNMRNFIRANYNKPVSEAVTDQSKVVGALNEVRTWKCLEDYSVTKFESLMAIIREILKSSYEDWKPREDLRHGELLGLMNIRLGAFRDSSMQKIRQNEVDEWLYKMSGSAFRPTLDLVSVLPKTTDVYPSTNGGFRCSGDVKNSLKRIDQAKRMDSLGYFTRTLYSFVTNAVVTKKQDFLPLDCLRHFNEYVTAVNSFDQRMNVSDVFRSSQELEKILYLMRVIMYQRPAYGEYSASAVVYSLRMISRDLYVRTGLPMNEDTTSFTPQQPVYRVGFRLRSFSGSRSHVG